MRSMALINPVTPTNFFAPTKIHVVCTEGPATPTLPLLEKF